MLSQICWNFLQLLLIDKVLILFRKIASYEAYIDVHFVDRWHFGFDEY